MPFASTTNARFFPRHAASAACEPFSIKIAAGVAKNCIAVVGTTATADEEQEQEDDDAADYDDDKYDEGRTVDRRTSACQGTVRT